MADRLRQAETAHKWHCGTTDKSVALGPLALEGEGGAGEVCVRHLIGAGGRGHAHGIHRCEAVREAWTR